MNDSLWRYYTLERIKRKFAHLVSLYIFGDFMINWVSIVSYISSFKN